MSNKKSHELYRVVIPPMTLGDPEGPEPPKTTSISAFCVALRIFV